MHWDNKNTYFYLRPEPKQIYLAPKNFSCLIGFFCKLEISSANVEDSEYTRNRHRYNLSSDDGNMVSFLHNIGHTLDQP